MTEINQSSCRRSPATSTGSTFLLAVVTGTILLLTGILVFTLRQKRTIKQLQTQHANDKRAAARTQRTPQRHQPAAETINDELSKANTVKDKYIRHYMQLSTLYINKLERFRVQLFKTFIRTGWTAFCANCAPLPPPNGNTRPSSTRFDTVFLSIYPDFIEQINALLHETERLKSTKLNYRISGCWPSFRLGITDNAQIAQFLHISINTVYTYRNRLRNAATIPPQEFEKRILRNPVTDPTVRGLFRFIRNS